MGRFYKTAKPVFVPNVAYQAPLDLMLKGIAQDNAIRDAAMQAAEQTRIGLQSQQYYNDSEGIEKARMQERQNHYENEINQIVDLINNSTNYSGLNQAQSRVSNELLTDMRTGELSKIAARYAGYSALMEDYNKTSEKDAYTANQVLNWELQQLDKAVLENKNSYSHNKMVVKPQLEKEFTDMVKAMKANKTFELTDGRIVTTEFLDENTLHQLALNELMSRPEYNSYVQQGVRIGMPGIVDSEGNVIQPYGIYDAYGNARTEEDLINYRESIAKNSAILQNPNSSQSDKETAISELQKLQQEGIRQGLNNSWAFYNDINKAGAFAYTQQDIKADQVEMQRRRFLHDVQMETIKQQNREKTEAIKQENRIELKGLNNARSNDEIVDNDGEPFRVHLSTSAVDDYSFGQEVYTDEEAYIAEQANTLWREEMSTYINNLLMDNNNSIMKEALSTLKNKVLDPNYYISEEQFENDLKQIYDSSEYNSEGEVNPYKSSFLSATMSTSPSQMPVISYNNSRLSEKDDLDVKKYHFYKTINNLRNYNKDLMSSISHQVATIDVPSDMVYTDFDEHELGNLNTVLSKPGIIISEVNNDSKQVISDPHKKDNVRSDILQSWDDKNLVTYVGKNPYGDPVMYIIDNYTKKNYVVNAQDKVNRQELENVVQNQLKKVYAASSYKGKLLMEIKYKRPEGKAKDLLERDLPYLNNGSSNRQLKVKETIDVLKMQLPEKATEKQIVVNTNPDKYKTYILKYSYKNESNAIVQGKIEFDMDHIDALLTELTNTDNQ